MATNTFVSALTNDIASAGGLTLNNNAGLSALSVNITFAAEMEAINTKITQAQTSDLSETEKMFTLQLLVNTYTTMGQTRTSMLKAHSDMLKSCARNIS